MPPSAGPLDGNCARRFPPGQPRRDDAGGIRQLRAGVRADADPGARPV